MDILNIYSISGLFYELYSPDFDAFTTDPLDYKSSNPLRRINALFWAQLFDLPQLEELIFSMEKYADTSSSLNEIERAVLTNKNLFKMLAHNAPRNIINQAISEREMFAYMEQIEITCRLYSKYLFSPFNITIQDGYQEPTLSAKALIEGLFDSSRNPYLDFLKKNVFSFLDSVNPKLIWINGQPRQSSLTIAAYLKKQHPNALIAIRNHSSEYFSLNKIDDLLVQNRDLFSIVDCIVLDDNQGTCKRLEQIVCNHEDSLDACPNLIYIDHPTNSIIKTKMQKVNYTFEESANIRAKSTLLTTSNYRSPYSIMNLRLNPNTACYWNKCTFCAINKKYRFISNVESETLDQKISQIESYLSSGIEYFWFEDEAIPPEILNELADKILDKHIHMQWQVRSRLDMGFSDKLAKKLFCSGLREIRFGLESANMRILGLMNKFPKEITLDIIERIVSICTKAGIHVHFPMIVGFPTETVEERIETYTFLSMLRERYVNVSYNINVLMLDICSDLFKNFPQYGICSISFPCDPKEFIGNMINYECLAMDEGTDSIDYKRNEFMRETLYPWMPPTAQIKPNIFYRLSETIRNTLVWQCKSSPSRNNALHYMKANSISSWKDGSGNYKIYDWFTHNLFLFSNEDYIQYNNISQLTQSEIDASPFYGALLCCNLLVPAER